RRGRDLRKPIQASGYRRWHGSSHLEIVARHYNRIDQALLAFPPRSHASTRRCIAHQHTPLLQARRLGESGPTPSGVPVGPPLHFAQTKGYLARMASMLASSSAVKLSCASAPTADSICSTRLAPINAEV